MRRMLTAVAVVVLVVPSVASAQRSSGRLKEGFGDPVQAAVTSFKLRDLDPVAILLKKHKDLNLTDDQTAKLKQIDDQLGQTQQPAMHSLDSLNQEIANLGPRPAGNDQSHAQDLNRMAQMVAGTVRQQYDSAENDAKALLSDEQKTKADDVLKDSHDKLSKLAGRGRRGG